MSSEQMQEMLEIIMRKPHAEWIRTYKSADGWEVIPEKAKDLELNVAMGVWVRDGNEIEIDNLITAAQAGYVDMAVVGNEELYSGTSVEDLINDINYVRQSLINAGCPNIPVTTPEPYKELFAMDSHGSCSIIYPELIDAVDTVMVNIYPFHEGTHVNVALQDLAQTYDCIANAVYEHDPNKKVIIGETGWASDGLTKTDAEPSLGNLEQYFSEVCGKKSAVTIYNRPDDLNTKALWHMDETVVNP